MEIDRMVKAGRPVLVGTTSVERSEHLSRLLSEKGMHAIKDWRYSCMTVIMLYGGTGRIHAWLKPFAPYKMITVVYGYDSGVPTRVNRACFSQCTT